MKINFFSVMSMLVLSFLSSLVEFGDSLPSASNLALNSPATASSSFPSSFAAEYGNDLNLSTKWASNTSESNPWWQVDLGQSYPVSKIELLARQDIDRDFERSNLRILASDDKSFRSYEILARQENTTFPAYGTWSSDIDNKNSFRCILVSRTNNKGYFSIAEFRVFEGKGNPYVDVHYDKEFMETNNSFTAHTNSYELNYNFKSGGDESIPETGVLMHQAPDQVTIFDNQSGGIGTLTAGFSKTIYYQIYPSTTNSSTDGIMDTYLEKNPLSLTSAANNYLGYDNKTGAYVVSLYSTGSRFYDLAKNDSPSALFTFFNGDKARVVR